MLCRRCLPQGALFTLPLGKKVTDQASIAWDNVDKLEAKQNYSKVVCHHCDHSFSGGVSRIVSHLLGTNQGVKACSECPEDIKTRLSTAKVPVMPLRTQSGSVRRRLMPSSGAKWTM